MHSYELRHKARLLLQYYNHGCMAVLSPQEAQACWLAEDIHEAEQEGKIFFQGDLCIFKGTQTGEIKERL